MNGEWHNVSKKEPCPICEHTDWCNLSNNGQACICRRVQSDHPVKSGIGWLHHLTEGVVKPYVPPTRPATTAPDIAGYFARLPTGDKQITACRRMAARLCVEASSLLALDMRWDAAAKGVAFPMRNAEGDVTGIRYRDPLTGRKWSKLGSKDGLFYGFDWLVGPEEIVICEGPSDAAAAFSTGIRVVGRSACLTGAKQIRELIRLLGVKTVTIVADNDPPKPSPSGGTWCPGYDGAKRLAEQLDVPARIILPPVPFKDLRDWYSRGALSNDKLKRAADAATWLMPRNDSYTDIGGSVAATEKETTTSAPLLAPAEN